jgi:3-deoxy-D-manno-octulosonate 8-phosphate phosphatase KdsC-like HAD superfamily phosphatase
MATDWDALIQSSTEEQERAAEERKLAVEIKAEERKKDAEIKAEERKRAAEEKQKKMEAFQELVEKDKLVNPHLALISDHLWWLALMAKIALIMIVLQILFLLKSLEMMAELSS